MSERALWNVLASCILGSQVSNSQLRVVLGNLDIDGLAEPWRIKAGVNALAKQFSASLITRPAVGLQPKRSGYRFPERGAWFLARAVKAVYRNGNSIHTLIEESAESINLRRLLVASIPGVGPKQASLFLLEIGVSDNFASLDRHLLRYIAMTGTRLTSDGCVIHVPVGLNEYERVESALRTEAHGIGVSLASLDTAIWVLMRAWSTHSHVWHNTNSRVS